MDSLKREVSGCVRDRILGNMLRCAVEGNSADSFIVG